MVALHVPAARVAYVPARANFAPRTDLVLRNGRHVSAGLLAVAAIGVASLMGALVVVAVGMDEAAGHVALYVFVVGSALATGLYAIRRPGSERFGRVLVATGLVWSLAALGESSSSVPYSAGRVFAWLIFPLLLYLMLAFPEGRLAPGRDRTLFGALLGLIVVLYLGSALVVEQYPVGTPWTSCGTDCPPNAFLVLPSEPGFVGSVLGPGRDLLTVLLLIAVTAALADRLRRAPALRRVVVAPVLVVSVVTTLVLATFLAVRRFTDDAELVSSIGRVWALCLPALAAAFSLGLLQRRLLVSNVLSGLAAALRVSLEPRHLATALRSATGDSSAEVFLRDRLHERWVRGDGGQAHPTDIGGPGRLVREIGDESGPVAAVVLDSALDDEELLDGIVSLTVAGFREGRLKSELRLSLAALEESRKRIATAAVVERRRIERDLHDGAQQRLIVLRMRLSLAEELLARDPGAAPAAIHDLGDDIDLALEEIRSLAHGIYPALLADRGLAEALRSVARRSPLRVDVRASELTRLSPEIESAVYFSCIEAVQNATKHASGATRLWLALFQRGDELAFEVCDDGGGFDPAAAPNGAGLRNMRDRIESLGGSLTLASALGHGTTIRGTVPLRSSSARRA